jgi:hypothetical protein
LKTNNSKDLPSSYSILWLQSVGAGNFFGILVILILK